MVLFPFSNHQFFNRIIQVLFDAVLASSREAEDPLEAALKRYLKKEILDTVENFQVLEFIPFNSDIKRSEATLQDNAGKVFKVTKGAPSVILRMLSDAPDIVKEIDEAIDEFAHRGYRTLAVARADMEEGENNQQYLRQNSSWTLKKL